MLSQHSHCFHAYISSYSFCKRATTAYYFLLYIMQTTLHNTCVVLVILVCQIVQKYYAELFSTSVLFHI